MFYVVDKVSGKRIERCRTREYAEGAVRVFTAHDIAHRECRIVGRCPDDSCSKRFCEMMDSNEPLFGDPVVGPDYAVVEVP